MTDVKLADAKARLSELIARVEAGEEVRITKHGKPVVTLTAIHAPRKPIDLAALQALTQGQIEQAISAGEFVRAMRDTDRY